MEKRGRARQAIYGNIIQGMILASWITKATDTHSEYVIGVLIAFRQQQWLSERFFLRHTYIACRVNPYSTNVENRVSS